MNPKEAEHRQQESLVEAAREREWWKYLANDEWHTAVAHLPTRRWHRGAHRDDLCRRCRMKSPCPTARALQSLTASRVLVEKKDIALTDVSGYLTGRGHRIARQALALTEEKP